jgi:hypothetical protein
MPYFTLTSRRKSSVIELFLLLATYLAPVVVSVLVSQYTVEFRYRFNPAALTASFRSDIRYLVRRSISEPFVTDLSTRIFALFALTAQAIVSAAVVIEFRQLFGLVTPAAPL